MESSKESGGRRVAGFVGWAVMGTLAALAVMELMFCAAFSLQRRLHPDELRAEKSPAYAGAAWVPELMREQAARLAAPYRYVPFRISGVTEWHGKYFNNDAHATGVWRRTVNPAGCEGRAKRKVWVFGGSTVYGTGVPDEATLPSYLSEDMNRDPGACVEVTNFGDESYVSTQEVLLLIEQLKRGGKPEVVIFYDGFNDAHVGMTDGDPWSAHYGEETIRERAEGTWSGRLDFLNRRCTVRLVETARHLWRRTTPASGEAMRAKAAAVMDNYEANENIARALGAAYHFKFYGFWQPMLFYGHKPLDEFEREIRQFDEKNQARFDAGPVVAAYDEAERRSGQAGFVNLTGVFDAVGDAMYIDEAHLAPRGNQLVANAIAKYVQGP